LLLPRLHAFFAPYLIADQESVAPEEGYFMFDGVPLKWHLPLGLLYDMYVMSVKDPSSDRAPLPFKLTLHFQRDSTTERINLINPDPVTMHDSFINSVKEADFLRSGTAKPIMTLAELESKALWISTQQNDLTTYSKIHQTLLPANGQMRYIPLRIYLPSSSEEDPNSAQMRVLQSHVTPSASSSGHSGIAQARGNTVQPQTLGSVLHKLLPALFPSRRTPMVARPILHGAEIPLSSTLEELTRWACYADGWLSLVVSIDS
jgi:autophagy-related protein 5